MLHEIYEIEELLDDDDEDIFNIIEAPRAPRVFRFRPNHLEMWTDQEFLDRFRLSKNTVQTLCDEIANDLEHATQQNHALTPMQQLLITLRFYAAGSMLIISGDFCGVHDSTTSRVIKRVSEAIARLAPRIIKFPETEEQMMMIKNDFFLLARFPNVIGAIDCTHVRIQSPGGEEAENYRNRKGWFSFNVQTVCDAKLKIRNIVARWPGATSDRTIFANSRIKGELEQGRFGQCFLLGDSGYTISEYLMTPLNDPETAAENLYNESHIRTRNTVERQYGIWKRRFPILRLEIRLKKEKVQAIIVATAVLHNLAIDNNDAIPEDDVFAEEDYGNQNIPERNNLNGNFVRQHLIDNYFSVLLP